jgi:hypothetical protein
LKLEEEGAWVEVRLRFEVGEEDEKVLVLRGDLHRSFKDEVGIKWSKKEGNSYWLSEVQAQIDQSLAQLR